MVPERYLHQSSDGIRKYLFFYGLFSFFVKEIIEKQPKFKESYEKQENILKELENLLNSPKPEDKKDISLEDRREECYNNVKKAKEQYQ